jgi:putative ABC transport system substrate-binding protein
MTGRRAFLAAFAAAPWIARAGTEPRRKRLAILFNGPREAAYPPFTKHFVPLLAKHGWVEGRTVEFLSFFYDGVPEKLEPLVRQVVETRPDAIWTTGTAPTRALQRATSTIPIVTAVGDPVEAGFARSLARPGGNITGQSHGLREWFAKMAEVARLALPQLRVVSAVVGAGLQRPRMIEDATQAAFRALGVEATNHVVGSQDEVRVILRALPRGGQGAAIFLSGTGQSLAEWSKAAIELRVPAIGTSARMVEAGALFSYEIYRTDFAQRDVALIDKVLRGADPATIPFELPDRSRLSVNLKTARAIGVTFPPDILLRADRVIE